MNRLASLLLDVKIVIAGYDQDVWYLLYRYDPEFRVYAQTDRAIRRFAELFTVATVVIMVHIGFDVIRTRYRLLGKTHRCGDLPAVVDDDGEQLWYYCDKLHRDGDLPARVIPGDVQEWYQHGKLHRDNDLPAVVHDHGGRMVWYQHDQLHRDGDLPAVIRHTECRWARHGGLHRENGLPAVINSGGQLEWYENGVWIRGCNMI